MDRFVPRDDAKRQRGRSQEKVQRKVFCVGMPNLVWVGRVGHGRHGGGALAMCGGPMIKYFVSKHIVIQNIFIIFASF